MRGLVRITALTLIVSVSGVADAKGTAGEVQHLLNYIKNTSCSLERNGKFYEGAEAVSHVEKKYDYYRDKIRTTEDFIKYAATKSLFSGNYYHVKCGNKPMMKTKDWLLQELTRIRSDS